MKNKIRNLTRDRLLLLFLYSIAGCGASGGEGASTDTDAPAQIKVENRPVILKTNLKCTTSSSLTYENFGNGFLLNYCSSCHSSDVSADERIGAPDGVDFNTQELTQIWRSNILKSLLSKDSPMPPDQGVSVDELSMFKEWLNCGAPAASARKR